RDLSVGHVVVDGHGGPAVRPDVDPHGDRGTARKLEADVGVGRDVTRVGQLEVLVELLGLLPTDGAVAVDQVDRALVRAPGRADGDLGNAVTVDVADGRRREDVVTVGQAHRPARHFGAVGEPEGVHQVLPAVG